MRPAVSVLQLDTRFPRIPGDVGCPATYRDDVEIITVPQATVDRIVSARPDKIDIAPFQNAIRLARGDIVVTSCGFLSYWQQHLSAAIDRPFISSALTALDRLQPDHEPGEIMILTFDAGSLTQAHLGRHAAFISGVVGLPRGSHLRQVISADLPDLDVDKARREIVTLAVGQRSPAHGHILLECTNLPPYKSAVQRATGLPITDILTEIERLRPGSVMPAFAT